MKAATSVTFGNIEYRFYIPNELVGRKEAKRHCKNDGSQLAVIKNKTQIKMFSKFIKGYLPHHYNHHFHVNSSENMFSEKSNSRAFSPRMVARSSDVVLLPSSKSLKYLDGSTNMSAANYICMRSLENLDLQNDKNQTPLPLADQNDDLNTKTNLGKQTSSKSFFQEHTTLTCVLGGLALGLLLSVVIVVVKIYKRRQKRQNV